MYRLDNQQKPWANAQAGEYGVVAHTSRKVAVIYKKSKLTKAQQAQASNALTQLKPASVAKTHKRLMLAVK